MRHEKAHVAGGLSILSDSELPEPVFPSSAVFLHVSSIPDMSQSSSSLSLQSLFNFALEDYANQTGTNLCDHPLVKQLETCNSVDSISSVLRAHARIFHEFREDGKIMKSLKSAIHTLHTLSGSSILGEGIGIVCRKPLIFVLCS